MRFKRLLALLLAAALALAVLVGCGSGQQSAARVLLNLLDGKYPNISIEIDPDLEADLRQAVNEGETDAEIRAALEKILGSGVSFRLIGDGQQGDSAWNLILYPGSDPDAAARSAYLEWDKIFSAFPSSGLYTAKLSMIETENGYAILVKATVDKAASRNYDDDDEPEDVVVEGTGFTYNVTKNTITVEADDGQTNGLKELFFGTSVDDKVQAARNSGFEKITIELEADSYSIDDTFAIPFKGTLQGKGKNATTINITDGKGLFAQIGESGSTVGKVQDITFDVQTSITNTYSNDASGNFAGAAAGCNYGEITNCDVTIASGKTIKADNNAYKADAGAAAGHNYGEITGCNVTIYGTVSAEKSGGNSATTGGLVGNNEGGTITDCTVTIKNGGSIQTATSTNTGAQAGGIAGYNSVYGEIEGSNSVTIESGGSIQATAISAQSYAYAGGLVGYNNSATVSGNWSGNGTITARVGRKTIDSGTYTYTYTATASSNSLTAVDPEDQPGNDIRAYAGTGLGFNNGYRIPVAHTDLSPTTTP